MRQAVRDIIGILVLATSIFFLLRLVVAGYSVNSDSMQPILQAGERILINKMAYNFDAPVRGEIVYCKLPGAENDQVKRIIGLPGDIIEIKNKAVYINGTKLTEPYVNDAPAFNLPPYQAPANSYFVLEDNRNNTYDSPDNWTVSRDNIIGRAWIYTWPPDRWGTVDGYPLDSELTSAQLH